MYWWHAVSFTERQADDVMLIDSNLKVPPSEPSHPFVVARCFHTCHHKKVYFVSQHSLKSVKKLPGDKPLHEKTWPGL